MCLDCRALGRIADIDHDPARRRQRGSLRQRPAATDAGRRRGRRPPAGDRGSPERPRAPDRAGSPWCGWPRRRRPARRGSTRDRVTGARRRPRSCPRGRPAAAAAPSLTVPWTTERAARRRQAELGERRRVRRAGRRDGNVARGDASGRLGDPALVEPPLAHRGDDGRPDARHVARRRCRARGRARRLPRAAPARRPPPSPPSRSPPSSRARR